MSCESCNKLSNYHSFEFITRLANGEGVFYTCPAKGKEKVVTEDSVKDYVAHMDDASVTSWIWIFDCQNLEKLDMPKVSVLKQLTELFQERYKFVLERLYIVHSNWRMQVILTAIKPFMKKETQQRLVLCDSPLQLLKLGIPAEKIKELFGASSKIQPKVETQNIK